MSPGALSCVTELSPRFDVPDGVADLDENDEWVVGDLSRLERV